jgi:hypothetical protein
MLMLSEQVLTIFRAFLGAFYNMLLMCGRALLLIGFSSETRIQAKYLVFYLVHLFSVCACSTTLNRRLKLQVYYNAPLLQCVCSYYYYYYYYYYYCCEIFPRQR